MAKAATNLSQARPSKCQKISFFQRRTHPVFHEIVIVSQDPYLYVDIPVIVQYGPLERLAVLTNKIIDQVFERTTAKLDLKLLLFERPVEDRNSPEVDQYFHGLDSLIIDQHDRFFRSQTHLSDAKV
jgi:hypothetical protein